MRTPQITSVETAIRIYYAKPEMNNADIKELFGDMSSATVARLKDRAKKTMLDEGIEAWGCYAVNTNAAYKAWGLDIGDLEKRYAKLKKYGMVS